MQYNEITKDVTAFRPIGTLLLQTPCEVIRDTYVTFAIFPFKHNLKAANDYESNSLGPQQQSWLRFGRYHLQRPKTTVPWAA